MAGIHASTRWDRVLLTDVFQELFCRLAADMKGRAAKPEFLSGLRVDPV